MFHSRNTRGSRNAHRSVSKTTCHPSVMSHMLPHLPQNNSARSLSPTSPVFRPSSLPMTLSYLGPFWIGVADTRNLHLPHVSNIDQVEDPQAHTCLSARSRTARWHEFLSLLRTPFSSGLLVTVQGHPHLTLLRFAHKRHHTLLLERKDVRCYATNCASCSA